MPRGQAAGGSEKGTRMGRDFVRSCGVLLVGLGVAAGVAGGCATSKVAIRHAAGEADEALRYDSITYQKARDQKIQIVLFHRMAAPLGEGDPDFEYVFLEFPESATYGWLKEDKVPIYRWVRQGKKDTIWQGTSGQVTLHFAPGDDHVHAEFHMTMEVVRGEGDSLVMTGNIVCPENSARTQGLVNRYGGWLETMLGMKLDPSEGKAPTVKTPGTGKKKKKI